jgi:hypothetical protein
VLWQAAEALAQRCREASPAGDVLVDLGEGATERGAAVLQRDRSESVK